MPWAYFHAAADPGVTTVFARGDTAAPCRGFAHRGCGERASSGHPGAHGAGRTCAGDLDRRVAQSRTGNVVAPRAGRHSRLITSCCKSVTRLAAAGCPGAGALARAGRNGADLVCWRTFTRLCRAPEPRTHRSASLWRGFACILRPGPAQEIAGKLELRQCLIALPEPAGKVEWQRRHSVRSGLRCPNRSAGLPPPFAWRRTQRPHAHWLRPGR